MERLGVRGKGVMVRGFILSLTTMLVLVGVGSWLSPVTPALAQVAGPPVMEKPAPPPEEKKEETAPTTCGPMISDTCLPIETGKYSMQVWWALSFYPGVFSQNWRSVNAGGNFHTFYMPVKFTYGPTKNMEMYVIVPFIHNWANSVTVPGPNGETSANFSGIGDITLMAKYNLLPETDYRPAVTAVGGFASIPTGHASHLNPAFLGQDAIGTGALTFTTGVNLYKWLKPFLVYSNIWLNSPINLYPIGSDPTRNVRSREYVTFNLAAELPLSKRFVALLEMYSNWTWSNLNTIQGYQTPETVIGVLPALEFLATEKMSFAAGCSFDLAGKNGVQKYTPMLTMLYNF
ncbi:MAG: transporter [Desulfobaccales bacterium]